MTVCWPRVILLKYPEKLKNTCNLVGSRFPWTAKSGDQSVRMSPRFRIISWSWSGPWFQNVCWFDQAKILSSTRSHSVNFEIVIFSGPTHWIALDRFWSVDTWLAHDLYFGFKILSFAYYFCLHNLEPTLTNRILRAYSRTKRENKFRKFWHYSFLKRTREKFEHFTQKWISCVLEITFSLYRI